jgi:pyruvate formate lyase activating enzyme
MSAAGIGAAGVVGTVFDIREFTVHDGPGIRTTVFLKGCPLRCAWCHNPEGLRPDPEPIRSPLGERIAGRQYTVAELAALLRPQLPLLAASGGGITFSGGEPLTQVAFVAAVADEVSGAHLALDTSGYGPAADFASLVSRMALVLFDLKLIDPERHRRYTGLDNAPILRNLRSLPSLGVPWIARVPLVPAVTDTPENLTAIAGTLRGLPGLQRIELLPYNRAAGGKYGLLGMRFCPPFDEQIPVNPDLTQFAAVGVEVKCRC